MTIPKKLLLLLLISMSMQVWAQAAFNGPNLTPTRSKIELKALEILKEDLKSEYPLMRMHAIEVVADSKEMALMSEVTKMLDDESEPVRFAAVLAIGDTNYLAASYALKKHKNDPGKSVQVAIAYALTKFNIEDDHSDIINATLSDDQTVKANAALVVGKLGDKTLSVFLHKILQDQKAQDKAKIQAIESLAMLKDPSSFQKGWALLISKRADDRIMGIRVMEHLKSREATNAIRTMYHDNLIEIQMAAAASLCRLGDSDGPIRIYQYFRDEIGKLSSDTKSRTNIQATIGLGYCKDKIFDKYLKEMIKNKTPSTRLYAAQAVLIRVKLPEKRKYQH